MATLFGVGFGPQHVFFLAGPTDQVAVCMSKIDSLGKEERAGFARFEVGTVFEGGSPHLQR